MNPPKNPILIVLFGTGDSRESGPMGIPSTGALDLSPSFNSKTYFHKEVSSRPHGPLRG